jgi:hypothetical protein
MKLKMPAARGVHRQSKNGRFRFSCPLEEPIYAKTDEDSSHAHAASY